MPTQEESTAFNTLSVDVLRFEREKRQLELSSMEERIARLRYQEGRSNDEWEQSFEGVRTATRKHSTAGGYQTDSDLLTERSQIEERIIRLRDELAAIELAMKTKERSS